MKHAELFPLLIRVTPLDDLDDYIVVPVICANEGYNATSMANSNISNGILEQNDS